MQDFTRTAVLGAEATDLASSTRHQVLANAVATCDAGSFATSLFAERAARPVTQEPDAQTDPVCRDSLAQPLIAACFHETLVPLARSVAPDRERLAEYVAIMCESHRFSNFGPLHEMLRDELRRWLDAEHLGLFANATLALTIALRAHGVCGEVITTPFSFAASAQSIEWAGARPVFVDIDPRTYTIDPECIEAAITPNTQAILAVHTYGVPCDVVALEAIAQRHDLKLIFDAAHAFDTRIDETPIHRFGDATIYSTHASKLFHTGEGGVLICNDRDVQTRAERMSNFGFDGSGDSLACGTNAKMSELHAATGLAVLPNIAGERKARATLRSIYREALNGIRGITMIELPASASDSLQYLAVSVDDHVNEEPPHASKITRRDLFHDRLFFHGLQSRKYFFPLLNKLSYSQSTNADSPSVLVEANRAARKTLCLPFHSGVTPRTVNAVAQLAALTLDRP